MTQPDELLQSIYDEAREEFEQNRRILSFPEYIDAFGEQPRLFARNSVQYLRDCFDYFGTEKIDRVEGEITRYRLFDAPFDDGRQPLVGQEAAQQVVYRLLNNFVRQGSINKLILLHGPNGSAKSTFTELLMRALEFYSRTEQGALYRFNWVFPNERVAGGATIGFEGFSARTAENSELDSFAFLEEEQIDAKMSSELKDHPLLLLPHESRQRLMRETIPGAVSPGQIDEASDGSFVISDMLMRGDLSHTSRQIYDALLTAYRGDLEQVFKHVQVERIYISRRYRVGAVTVGPQMRVDANLRQLTVDRSLGALPSSLQNQTIIEPFGDLVDANRGIISYDDLFKRHPDMNKYLLITSEKGTVTLENRILHLDTVLMGTGNESYLDAFKQSADYASFKGRMELVRLPYLLDYDTEHSIYRDHLSSIDVGKPIAPHTAYVTALWAVLTRLKRPDADDFPDRLRETVARLTPLEKADLYARGKAPEWVSTEEARELKGIVGDMRRQGQTSTRYEGRHGASPREIKVILLNASQLEDSPCLSPLAVLRELRSLVEDPSVFHFLQMEPDGDYHSHDDFIDVVTERYLDILDREVQDAMGLVEEEQYEELFSRYIDHVNQHLKGETVYNRITGSYEEPDEQMISRSIAAH
jgi:predicted Ser/Thr protein kinase